MRKLQWESTSPAPRRQPNKKWSHVYTSSRQVWLAGLGAMAQAEVEGAKSLDGLIQRGQDVERRLARTADARPLEARRLHSGEKLGLLFEQRVARALDRLGVRPATDITKIAARVEKLSARVDALTKQLADFGATANEDHPRSKQKK